MRKTFLITLEVVFTAMTFKPEAEEFPTENKGKEIHFCWDQLCARHRAKSLLYAFPSYCIHRSKFARMVLWIFIPVLGTRI